MMESEPIDEKAIFNTARKISDSSAREDYLRLACGGDPARQQRLQEMLSMHAQSESFLESPPVLDETHATLDGVTERAGDMIGPYKLLQQIGDGGMGVVYLAEQKEPVKRRVALKIIKPGMDTRQVIARFEAERQALAMMDHPNIARVFDAGQTESGRPCFVMELVNGMPVTEYCDREQLTTQERLKLFVPICHAVQHAHQKGVIHRDLKPGNILVTLYDGVPVPKVIDFGIAKATNQQLTEKTLFTNFGTLIGTPTYMSPEQAEMSGLDIDTRSDIYSLGVLLYELLTGNTPFDQKRLLTAGYAEMQRIIAEEDPPRPSNRLTTLGEASGEVADKRGTDSRKLSQLVRGDLDWIAMKALEKDRKRRYATAEGFAEDVQRYLSDEPVQACPPSSAYRLRKFVSRNRKRMLAYGGLAAVVLVAANVVIAMGEQDRELKQLRREQGRLVVEDSDKLNLMLVPNIAKTDMDWNWRAYAPPGKRINICFANRRIPWNGLPDEEQTYVWRTAFDSDEVIGSKPNGSLIQVSLLKSINREDERWRVQLAQGAFKTSWPLEWGTIGNRWSMTEVAGTLEDDGPITRPVGDPLVLLRYRLGIDQDTEDGSTSSRMPMDQPLDGFMLWIELSDS